MNLLFIKSLHGKQGLCNNPNIDVYCAKQIIMNMQQRTAHVIL